MKIVAETIISDTTHHKLVVALTALGFVASEPSAKTNWRGDALIVEQTFTMEGASLTLTLDTNEPTPMK